MLSLWYSNPDAFIPDAAFLNAEFAMEDVKDAFDRGLKGMNLQRLLDPLLGPEPTQAERDAYERGREAKEVMDERERRSQ